MKKQIGCRRGPSSRFGLNLRTMRRRWTVKASTSRADSRRNRRLTALGRKRSGRRRALLSSFHRFGKLRADKHDFAVYNINGDFVTDRQPVGVGNAERRRGIVGQ